MDTNGRHWIMLGIVSGFLTLIAYPMLLFASMPMALGLVVAAAFGIFLTTASVGLYRFLALHRNTLQAQLGALFNTLGAAVFVMMVFIQVGTNARVDVLAQRASTETAKGNLAQIASAVDAVQLSLDVVWDVYIALGTVMFALAMFAHPRFGRAWGLSGILVGLLIVGLNVGTFPTPPANAGLFDPGPLMGLWYLMVTVQLTRSRGWYNGILVAR